MKARLPFKKRLRLCLGDWAQAWGKLRRPYNNGFRVLLYHSITDWLVENDWAENTVPKELFAAQMHYLADKKYNVISCAQAVRQLRENKEIPNKTVALAFDDGYRNNITNALPVLKQYGFSATIFLALELLGEHSGSTEYLDSQELAGIKQSGLVDFGCHGLTHRALPLLNEQELELEIGGAKQQLERLTGSKIELFAYPFGHSKSYNKNVLKKIEASGFTGAFTTISGLNHYRRNRFTLNRNRISWIDQLNEFDKQLNGAYDWCALFECLRLKRYNYAG